MPLPPDPNRLLGTRAACRTALRVASIVAWILSAIWLITFFQVLALALAAPKTYGILVPFYAVSTGLFSVGGFFLRRQSRVAAVSILVWELATLLLSLAIKGFNAGVPMALAELIVFIVAVVAAFRWHALAPDEPPV